MKVLGLGNALVDVLIPLDDDSILIKLGYPKGSMQLIDSDDIDHILSLTRHLPSTMSSGGSAANTIHGLACLNAHPGYIGKVGTDFFGTFYLNDLKSATVNTNLVFSNNVTGRAFTLITPDTERTFATYLGAAVEMQASELSRDFFGQYSILHVEGYLLQNSELIETAVKIAKSMNMLVSLDLASYNVVESNLEFLKTLVSNYVDILFANEDEARAFTGKDPEGSIIEFRKLVGISIIKMGKEGSIVCAGNNTERIGTIPVPVLDSTGAGDQYAAGFLYGFTNQLSIEKCGKIGALLAGNVIRNYGARIPSDQWDKIKEEVMKITEL